MSRLRHPRPSRAMVVALLALGVALGGQNAYATVKTFMLGTSNSSDAPTTVTATSTWPTTGSQRLLQLTNTNATAGATALGLNVATGHAPFTVNSATKVTNLNADKLDGIDGAQLQRRVTGGCLGGRSITSIAVDGGVACSGPLLRARRVAVAGPFPNASNVGSFFTDGGPLLVDFTATGFSHFGNEFLAESLIACPTSPCASGTSGAVTLSYLEVYTNEANSHKVLAGTSNLITLPAGTYYLNILTDVDTHADSNDDADWMIVEYGS